MTEKNNDKKEHQRDKTRKISQKRKDPRKKEFSVISVGTGRSRKILFPEEKERNSSRLRGEEGKKKTRKRVKGGNEDLRSTG